MAYNLKHKKIRVEKVGFQGETFGYTIVNAKTGISLENIGKNIFSNKEEAKKKAKELREKK